MSRWWKLKADTIGIGAIPKPLVYWGKGASSYHAQNSEECIDWPSHYTS